MKQVPFPTVATTCRRRGQLKRLQLKLLQLKRFPSRSALERKVNGPPSRLFMRIDSVCSRDLLTYKSRVFHYTIDASCTLAKSQR